MLLSSKIKSLFFLVCIIAFTVSCSDDDEIIEQQDPQTQISDELKLKLIENTEDDGNQGNNEEFENQTNWYKSSNISSSYCGIEAALLAYEIFDADNNSLNGIQIVPWSIEFGLSIEDVVAEVEQQITMEFGSDVDLIFVAGLLINSIDETSFEVAEISNYATFSDYFDDCQSPDVTFQIEEGTFDFDLPMPEPDDVDFPDENPNLSCVTLDFPVDILVADVANINVTTEVNVDLETFLDYLLGDVSGSVFVDFVYPVSLTTNEGEQLFANNQAELDQILSEDCD